MLLSIFKTSLLLDLLLTSFMTQDELKEKIVRILWNEARGEGYAGMQAVGSTMLNRMKLKITFRRKTLEGVVTKKTTTEDVIIKVYLVLLLLPNKRRFRFVELMQIYRCFGNIWKINR